MQALRAGPFTRSTRQGKMMGNKHAMRAARAAAMLLATEDAKCKVCDLEESPGICTCDDLRAMASESERKLRKELSAAGLYGGVGTDKPRDH